MRFSLRTKILAAYGVLFTLFLLILLTGFSQFRQIASRLNVIQLGYLPITKTVNTFSNFYHMNEAFDVHKIIANQSNRMFLDSIAISNPRLLEQGFRKGINDARATLRTSSSPKAERALDRVTILANTLLEEHKRYTALIHDILGELREAKTAEAAARNEELLHQKRMVRAQIDALSRKLDEMIRDGIKDTVTDERNAVGLILTLSILTFVLAVGIGRMAIVALRPLGKLKQAAKEIGAGDLQRRVSLRTRDEVGELAHEFNRMADSIQSRDEALKQQQEELLQSEKMAVIGRMASKISHEVRNPLNALSLNIEMLEEDVAGDEAKKTLKAMSNEIDRLNTVAENYLNLARTPKQVLQEADLSKILSHLEALVKPECEKRGIEIRIEKSAPLPPLHVDVARLEQALLNLAKNAMEAVKAGGKLGIRAQKENGGIALEIWDSGPGIPDEILPHVFEPFYTTKEKGTGLGLAITSEIIRDQGGSIEYVGKPGGGSTFRVRLPAKTA